MADAGLLFQLCLVLAMLLVSCWVISGKAGEALLF